MAKLDMKLFLNLSIYAKHLFVQVASTTFQVFKYDQLKMELSLLVCVANAEPTGQLSRAVESILKTFYFDMSFLVI